MVAILHFGIECSATTEPAGGHPSMVHQSMVHQSMVHQPRSPRGHPASSDSHLQLTTPFGEPSLTSTDPQNRPDGICDFLTFFLENLIYF